MRFFSQNCFLLPHKLCSYVQSTMNRYLEYFYSKLQMLEVFALSKKKKSGINLNERFEVVEHP